MPEPPSGVVPGGAARGGGVLGVVAFALFLILFLTGLGPFSFDFHTGDMEGGWITASTYASLHRFAYGTQFVFTNGPLFPLYHREVAGGLTGWYVAARLAIVFYLAYGFARLSITPRAAGWLVTLLAFALLWPTISRQTNDAMLLIVPLLTVLLLLARRAGWPTLIVGVFLAAALGLAKVSFIPFCLGAFALADIALLSRRKLPLSLVLYVAASWGLFILAGQRAGDFLPFLTGSAEMAAAYSAGLSLDGPLYELAGWLLLAAFTIAVTIGSAIRTAREGQGRAIDAILRVLLVVGFLFIAMKAAFVRQDSHSVAGWGMLAYAMIVLGLPGTLIGWRPRVTAALYAVPTLAVAGAFGFSLITGTFRDELINESARALVAQIEQAASLGGNPVAWIDAQQRTSDAYDARVRAEQPLPPIAGRIDAISNVQQSILAAGLEYWPRPTIQENMTVSPALIERNQVFFESPEAPPTLIFAPGATDSRHPASVEGSLWPLFLADYAVTARERDQLILTRRAVPLAISRSPIAETTIGFDEELPLPQMGQPLFLSLDITETALGRLMDQAFRPPLVHLVVTYPDDTAETYRLIPGMIHEGMVVAPTIRTSDDYAQLAGGRDLNGMAFPSSIRIETDGRWAYAPTIAARIEALALPPN